MGLAVGTDRRGGVEEHQVAAGLLASAAGDRHAGMALLHGLGGAAQATTLGGQRSATLAAAADLRRRPDGVMLTRGDPLDGADADAIAAGDLGIGEAPRVEIRLDRGDDRGGEILALVPACLHRITSASVGESVASQRPAICKT